MRDLLDTDGENRAVRAFLLGYDTEARKSVGAMKKHMEYSGRPCWPKWVDEIAGATHLTKAGAQDWLRYLFNLENCND